MRVIPHAFSEFIIPVISQLERDASGLTRIPGYNTSMEITIEKIVYPGKSLARYQQKVLFTNEGLPGETIEVENLTDRKNFYTAETIHYGNPSQYRRRPRCDHYTVCAPYQYIDYDYQLLIKKQQVQEMFSHHLKTDLPEISVCASPHQWGYRNKIHLHLFWEKKVAQWAYHIPQTRDSFVPVHDCALVSDQMNSYLLYLRLFLQKSKIYSVKEITLRETTEKKMLLALYGLSAADAAAIAKNAPDIVSSFPLQGIAGLLPSNDRYKEKALFGEPSLIESLPAASFSFGAQSFFQVNIPCLRQVITDMENLLQLRNTETIADLFCGVGTFGLSFAKKASQILAVDSEMYNTAHLEKNISRNSLTNVILDRMPCEQWLAHHRKYPMDILIIDPPRKGLDPQLCRNITEKKVPKIWYLSCDPSTLVRDLQTLLQAYTIKTIRIYDFFPHTPHIETGVLLERK